MTGDASFKALPRQQQESIERLRVRIRDWLCVHPKRASDFQSITLFGSRAVGLADSELSDWDLFVILKDDAPKGTFPSGDLDLHDNCLTEWHKSTVSDYLAAMQGSSIGISRSVQKFGIPIYKQAPDGQNLNSGDRQLN